MARIRSLKPEFWDDRKLARSTSRDARMLYMGLWNQSDEHSRLNGDAEWIRGRVFPYEADIDTGRVKELLGELIAAGRVVPYEVDGDPFLYLSKLSKHQRLEPAKVESRLPEPPAQTSPRTDSDPDANSSARGADESARRSDIPAEVPITALDVRIPPDSNESARDANSSALLYVAGSMGHVAGSMGVAPVPGADESRPDVDRLCNLLADGIEANGTKRPVIGKKWRDAARLMLDTDGRTEEQIRGAIEWSQAHPFWRSNILSMPKLREKYDQMRLQADREGPPGGKSRAQQETDAMFERAARRMGVTQ